MGPQLYRCGNPAANKNNAVRIYKLQWGRNFIVAEIHLITVWAAASCSSFNGAATLSLRKYSDTIQRRF